MLPPPLESTLRSTERPLLSGRGRRAGAGETVLTASRRARLATSTPRWLTSRRPPAQTTATVSPAKWAPTW
jgi:hypothetical protein